MSTKKVEVWVHPKDDDSTIEVRISRERLALALIGHASETAPLILHEAWANGDSAKVIIKRIPWRDTEWRETPQGWVRGPFLIEHGPHAATKTDGYFVRYKGSLIEQAPCPDLSSAKVIAANYADKCAWEMARSSSRLP